MAVIYIREDTDLPERIDKDFYPTPHAVVKAVMFRFCKPEAVSILDIGAADGRWGIGAAKLSHNPLCLAGVDIRDLPKPDNLFTFWHTLDYSLPFDCLQMSVKSYDLIVSNPPFARAEPIVWNAWRQLNPGGRMIFLLPFAFWFGKGRFSRLWGELPPKEVSAIVSRIPFTGKSNPDNHAVYVWEKDAIFGAPIGAPNQTKLTQMDI